MRRAQIILIDSEFRRRAQVAFRLTDPMTYVLPLEDVAEVCDAWPEQAVFLVEDRADNIVRLTRMLRRRHCDFPFIAFAPSVETKRRAAVLKQGAREYLACPDLVEAAQALVLQALTQVAIKPEPGPAVKPGATTPGAASENSVVGSGEDSRSEYLIHGQAQGRHHAEAASLHDARADQRAAGLRLTPLPSF